MSRTVLYAYVNMILDFPVTYTNDSVRCQSERVCLHKTVNILVFFTKNNKNFYPKVKALMQMYRVVPQTKKGKYKGSLLIWHLK